MKINKLFVLLSALTLIACSSNSNTNPGASSSLEPADSSSAVTNPSSQSDAANSSNADANSSLVASSSNAAASVSTAASSSSAASYTHTYTFNFYDPSCGSGGSNVLDNKLKEYMNETATGLVSSVTNSNCQIMANAPETGHNYLTVGSSSAGGELEFTFSTTIAAVTINAQTYYKRYQQNGSGPWVTNPDTGSILYVNADANVINLAPEDGQPVEKQLDLTINSNKLKLYNKADKNRAYIKSITLMY